jgi:hypothetical protein
MAQPSGRHATRLPFSWDAAIFEPIFKKITFLIDFFINLLISDPTGTSRKRAHDCVIPKPYNY